MQNYKDLNNKPHALDSTEFEHYLPQGCIAITQAEADAINMPTPSIESIRLGVLQKVRASRTPAFAALDIMRQDELVIIGTSLDTTAVATAKLNAIAIQAFIQGLREATTSVVLSAFTTELEMLTAFSSFYKALVLAAPTALRLRFKAALAGK